MLSISSEEDITKKERIRLHTFVIEKEKTSLTRQTLSPNFRLQVRF